MKRVKTSFTDNEYSLIEFEAKSKGLTVSAFIKMTAFNYVNKYPVKGLIAELYKLPVKVPEPF